MRINKKQIEEEKLNVKLQKTFIKWAEKDIEYKNVVINLTKNVENILPELIKLFNELKNN